MANDPDKDLLLRVARSGKTPEGRAEAAKTYRELYGEAIPASTEPPAASAVAPKSAPTTAAPDTFAEEPARPSPTDRAWNWLKKTYGPEGLKSEAHSLGAIFGLVEPNEVDIERMNRIETLGERASNMATLGASRPIMDALGASSPQRRAALEAHNPKTAFFGDLLGATTGALAGPARALDMTVRAGAQRLFPATANTLAGQTATGAASGVAENAAMNFAGDGSGTLAERVARMPEGARLAAGVGGGGAVVGDLLDATASLVRRGSGWIRAYADAAKPPTMRGVDGQPARGIDGEELTLPSRLESPEVSGTPDVQEAADRGFLKFVRRRNELIREGQETLRKKRAPYVDTTLITRKGMLDDIDEQIQKNIGGDGQPNKPELHRQLTDQRERLLNLEGRGMGPPAGEMTYGDAITRRAAARSSSGHSNPSPTDPQLLARADYDLYKNAIRRQAPADALEAEAEAAASAKARRRDQDIALKTEKEVDRGSGGGAETDDIADDLDDLGLPELEIDQRLRALNESARKDAMKRAAEGTPDLKVSDELAGSMFFSRVGDTTKPGQRNRKLLDELAATDPEYADIIRYIRDVKAREATALDYRPRVDTNLTGALGVFGVTPAVEQFLRFSGGRLVEPALVAGARGIPKAAPRLVPLLDPLHAWQESRRRKKEKENR